jgi:ATP-binding cassette, subfamily F, member 3
MKTTIQELTKSYGGHDLFDSFSLELHAGTRLAVVGPNGAGKSTLLRILAGVTQPEGGRVLLPKGARLGYVAQELEDMDLRRPLLDFVLEVLPSWAEFWQEWEQAQNSDDQAGLERLSKKQAELEAVYGYNPEQRAHAVLTGLGFPVDEHHRPLQALSGGWRERAKLARVLVAGADVLLLDEPTNHLDLEAVEWLESFLLEYEGVLVFVAHDRVFIDRVGTHVLLLGGSKPLFRKGSFAELLSWQEEQEEQRQREAKRLADEIERKLDFVRRFKAKASKARQAGSKKKQAQRMEKELGNYTSEPKRKTLRFAWPEPKRGDKVPVAVAGLSLAYADAPLWQPLTFSLYRGQKIALAGPNGCGKSTLLKLVGRLLPPTQGYVEISSATEPAYFSQHQLEILNPEASVLGEIRRLGDPRTTEEELMSVLGLFMLGQQYFDRLVHTLSGGEKSRLLLASMFLTRANLLLMDEPTNHLDLESREALMQALEDYSGTMLFVAHDRLLMQRVAEHIWELSPAGITAFDSYEEYDASRRQRQQAAPQQAQVAEQIAGRSMSREEAKELKRRQAALRNEIYRALKPLKASYAKVEKELEDILAAMTDAEQSLADPAVYADAARSTELLEVYTRNKERSEGLFERLAELEAEIQDLEERRAGLAEDA